VNLLNTTMVKWVRAEYVILILVVAFFLLTPRGFEPGGESFKAWAAARLLAETGDFTVFSRNPLYVAYLTLFLKLPFPASLILAFSITHLFAIIAIYALLRTSLSRAKSLILSMALAPAFGIIEGGGTVAAVGFFSLYLRSFSPVNRSAWPFLSATLLSAALCHPAYVPFLALHFLVSCFLVLREKLQGRPGNVNYGCFQDKAASLLLVGFAVAVFLFQSGRVDNNNMLMDPMFAPIPLSSSINTAFFQIKTWGLVVKNYAPSVLHLKDWYYETPKFFGDSKTIMEVASNDPKLFLNLFFKDIGAVPMLPLGFYSSYFFPAKTVTGLVSMLVLTMLLMGVIKLYRVHGIAPLFILFIGGGGVIVALLLTHFSLRYQVILLPIFLLTYSLYLGDTARVSKNSIYESPRVKNSIFVMGCLLVFSAAPFWFHNERSAEECVVAGNLSFFSKVSRLGCRQWKGMQNQIIDIVNNNHFLDRRNSGVSVSTAYPVLSRLIDKRTRILSLEDIFFGAFTDVGIDNNRQIVSLPPYEDKSEYTNNFLNKIDIIFISESLTVEAASVSTQTHLRYRLHILPYLNARKSEFSVVEVPSYGNAYVRKKLM
jgi:hypothetical protein